jgi:hypothetical protein
VPDSQGASYIVEVVDRARDEMGRFDARRSVGGGGGGGEEVEGEVIGAQVDYTRPILVYLASKKETRACSSTSSLYTIPDWSYIMYDNE